MPSSQASTASLTIRNLDPALKERLRIRAAEHGRSMEAEGRDILRATLAAPVKAPKRSFYDRLHEPFAAVGGFDDFERQP